MIIGNGGAEYGVRGYVSAYDAETGKMAWRFYTVPGDPKKGFENKTMEMAAKTWTGQWWKYGGGGTVWDSMAYDAELDLLYIGVGNGSPWDRDVRSPKGGDNLFLSSIVALRPDTGKYVWHYQTTPGDTWDYTATQHMILLNAKIAGEDRKLLVQAPKNGFFYVLDRTNGSLISAEKVRAGHLGLQGRPQDRPAGRDQERALSRPEETGFRLPLALRRPQLASDGVQPEDGPRLSAGRRKCRSSTASARTSSSSRASGTSASSSPTRRCPKTVKRLRRSSRSSRDASSPGIRSGTRRCSRSSTPDRGTAASWRPRAT